MEYELGMRIIRLNIMFHTSKSFNSGTRAKNSNIHIGCFKQVYKMNVRQVSQYHMDDLRIKNKKKKYNEVENPYFTFLPSS